jgi:RNA-binding protein 25
MKTQEAKAKIDSVVNTLKVSADAGDGTGEKERYIIPPHLHDLQEAELPEAQRGLVISEIALFRERAAKREREKLKDERERGMAFGNTTAFGAGRGGATGTPPKGPVNAPSGPKERAWGRGQGQQQTPPRQQGGHGPGAQGYSKPVGFVPQSETSGEAGKTDEQREQERKDARARDENESFRDVRRLSILGLACSLTVFSS